MKVTRLQFLSSVGSAVAVGALLPATPFLEAEALADETAASRFSAQVGTPFAVTGPGQTSTQIYLQRVNEGPSDAVSEQFSLVFAANPGAAPAQGTYTVQHASLGSMSMFLAPGGEEPSSSLVRADFNLLK